ncbi:EAL domain-containing protein [Massilia arenosa]|uniref:EAL domain-containing protein n=1 Tax=Zemynaea arenosa TaxID=2561931 RepID=A0A4Y9SJ78_9BURK|nr:EAL domain-containing protein [Massilia arenosa]TFW25970.1 EAL domain-containing protein [Massilia arenosa]
MNTPRVLGRRLTLVNMITAGAALLVASLALIGYQYVSLRGALVDDLRTQARIIGSNSSAALMFGDSRAGEETLQALVYARSVTGAAIFGSGMRPLASYRTGGVAPPAPGAELLAHGHSFSWQQLDVVEPVQVNGQPIGYVAIRASLDGLYTRLATYAGLTLGVALCSLALAWLLVASMRGAVRRAEAHLHFLAHVDPVTGLPNRNEFNERLAFEMARARRHQASVGLLLLDLDNFKVVNDTLGHDRGDLLLQRVAARLQQALRATDIICRLGGDEFVVIVEQGAGDPEVEQVAARILLALQAPFDLEGQQHYVTASVGVSQYPRDADDARSLVRTADTAMYHAKNRGKNDFQVFHSDMAARAHKRMRMEAELRRALQAGELHLHYQPQVDVATRRIVGLEALARWDCPGLGAVPPSEFIPLAEESGMIVPLGRWVLEAACRQAAAWRAAGLLAGVDHIAVNLSARQTKDEGLMDEIRRVLAATGLPPQLLELEITEGVLMENVHANIALLHQIQQAGIHLSIDDFGTGYSSLSYLKRFPIDQLKIDRSFVQDCEGQGGAIALAVIALARSLGLRVVAEGAETAAQVEFVARAGCAVVQGFYFARPLPAGEITLLLQRGRIGD